MRRITISERSRHDVTHIEAPGCIINIRHRLTDIAGRRVVSVQVIPDRCMGERWELPDFPDAGSSLNVRVRQVDSDAR
jgi:hypothetical protein